MGPTLERPFFSVIIPTKNRSTFVGAAIESVLGQTCKDFELVLVDNDDSEGTARVAAAHPDTRMRYVRSGGLTMPDNWELGYARAAGLYLLLLEDKSLLRSHALDKIRDAIKRASPGVISWKQDVFNDLVSPPCVIAAGGSGKAVRYSSEEVLRMFLDLRRSESDLVLPRGLNSCMSRRVYEEIASGPAGRLCPPNCPDYTMAFQQLAVSESVLHIDEALTVYGSCYHSQGRRILIKADSPADLAKNFSTDLENFVDLVPVKAKLVGNLLFNDYLRIRALIGGRLEKYPLNPISYFVECYLDLQAGRNLGADMEAEQQLCDTALAGETMAVRRAVKEQLFPRDPHWKRVAKRLGLQRLHRAWLAWRESRNRLPHFGTAVEYVAWLEHGRIPQGARTPPLRS